MSEGNSTNRSKKKPWPSKEQAREIIDDVEVMEEWMDEMEFYPTHLSRKTHKYIRKLLKRVRELEKQLRGE